MKCEEESGDEGLLKEALSEKGDSIPRANLNKRIKELMPRRPSAIMDAMTQLVALFDENKTVEMEVLSEKCRNWASLISAIRTELLVKRS